MQTPFITQLRNAGVLSPAELRFLSAVNVSSAEMLASVIWNFPSLAARFEVDAPKLTNLSMQAAPGFLAVMAEGGVFAQEPPQLPIGAIAPPGTDFVPGQVAADDEPGAPAQPIGIEQTVPIDKRPVGVAWPARNQGARGTCVAFAVTALRERLAHSITGALPDLSEQFLFWATKTQTADPMPNGDGTWIEFALSALRTEGICDEATWPYNGTPIPGNVSHGGAGLPTAGMRAAAVPNAVAASTYFRGAPAGNAARVLAELMSCRPVAVSLPVFADPLRPTGHNWNSPIATLYGKVIDPPPSAVVVGGHAVCVTGFRHDVNDPLGGVFIIRNSWGVHQFGARLPQAGYAGPEPGYGEVSASYIDRFLWECGRL